MLFRFNKIGDSPAYYEYSEVGDWGLTFGGFVSAWPSMWFLLYINENADSVSTLWSDMFSGGILNFIVCNIALFIKSYMALIVNIMTWIFS